jgi:hypothetical protein
MGDVRALRWDQLVAALNALVQAGVPTDVQELLLYGNPDRGVKPKALESALAAALKSGQS